MARLLVFEGDPATRDTVCEVGTGLGMETRPVVSPPEFYTVLERWEPTHVVLDLYLPGSDGVDLIKGMARADCNAFIILLSGLDERVLEAAGRSAVEEGLSVMGTLNKPLVPAALQELLHNGRTLHLNGAPSPDTPRVEAHEIERAIAQREFHLVFQPKIACRDRRLAGFEALVRWRHPVHGEISPDAFIPLSEKLGSINRITTQVLDAGMKWLAAHLPVAATTLSINLSARALSDPDFVRGLDEACAANGLAPERVILELTETAALDDPLAATELLIRLRVKGYQVSLDDFGAGYSSLVQLSRMPFSELKIDKHFVLNAMESAEARTIIETVVRLGQSLKVLVCAEGVEDEATLAYLAALGCDYAQGYYISRPLAPGEAAYWPS